MKTRWAVWLAITWSLVALGQGTLTFVNINSGAGLNAPILGLDGKTNLQGADWMVELLVGPDLDRMSSVATTGFSTQAPGYFNGGVVTIPKMAPGSNVWCVVLVFSRVPFASLVGTPINFFYSASEPFQVVLGGGMQRGPPDLPAPLVGLTSFDLALRLKSQLTSTNTLALTWSGFDRAIYRLEESPGLTPGHWVALTNVPNLGAPYFLGKFSVTIPPPQGSIFYRVMEYPPIF